jgi:hypothetical protein
MKPMDEEAEVRNDSADSSTKEQKVIIHRITGEVVKAYIGCDVRNGMASFFETSEHSASGIIPVRRVGMREWMPIEVREIKSIFLVKSFRGDPKRKALRFYRNGPALGNIWVEIQFKDNEILEGLIENSVQHLMGDGLLLTPSDPGSNNICMYVNKAAIANYRVLGVKALR